MEMDASRTEAGTDNKSQVKLKFGIERLLSKSTEPATCNIRLSLSRPSVPIPTVAVPCSDCVTSLFRCCRLGPRPLSDRQEEGLLGQNHHNTFAPLPSSSTTYTVHPIKPFPTRPSKYLTIMINVIYYSIYNHYPHSTNTVYTIYVTSCLYFYTLYLLCK